MNKITAVIIEDELLNRELVRSMLTRLNPAFNIIGEAENVKDAYKLIKEVKPMVVFLDIKMPDGSGFDLLRMFDKINFEIVFITGFDEYALQAFEFNALDYVLKPIDMDKFKRTLNVVQKRIEGANPRIDDLKKIFETYDPMETVITKIPIHYNDKVVLLNVEEIIYIHSEDGCSVFSTNTFKKYTSSKQLSDFSFIFNNFQNFVRINRGIYININYISNYSKGLEYFITMSDGNVFEISRRRKSEILQILGNTNKHSK